MKLKQILFIAGVFLLAYSLGHLGGEHRSKPSPNFIAVVNEDGTEIEYYFPVGTKKVTVNIQ